MTATTPAIDDWQLRMEEYRKRRADRERSRTTPSKYRKGFPVKLNGGWALSIRMGYDFYKARNLTTPGMDEAIKLIPEVSGVLKPGAKFVDGGQGVTLRIRGDQVDTMIELLEAVYRLANMPYAIRHRIDDLRKITTVDRLMDVGR